MSWALKTEYTERDVRALTLDVLGTEGETVEVYRRSPEGLIVPRAYEGFQHIKQGSGVFRVSEGSPMRREAQPISLRDEQVPAVKAVIDALGAPGRGAILFAPCGKGKTVMGLEMARRLGRKTLVLVHKTFLVEQWVERATMFLPELKIGFWQRDDLPAEDDDIVIGMVQSIVNPRRDYDSSIYEQFGLIIADETHRYAAPSWQEAISRFPAMYRIGLTATPERKDGLHKVFMLHIGPIVYRMNGHSRAPVIFKVNTGVSLPTKSFLMRGGNVNTAKLITLLSEVRERTDMACDYAIRAARTGRKVLILTERIAHSKLMRELISEQLGEEYQVSLYIGASTEKQRREASEAEVVIGSYAMAQEGLDIPALDTLILATPKTSVTQSIGRILREAPDKKDPVVVDLVDDIDILGAYWGARKRLYNKLNYTVRNG
jgi:superfamily II DNA or RNA helicase